MERANKPLTLEQLREMRENTEIIGPSVLSSWNGLMAYGVLDEHTDDGICAVVGVGVWLKEKDYGKSWLAYAQQPAHIDREKWDGCEWCCDEILFDSEAMSLELLHPLRDDNPQTVNPNYCPMCGRPLTEEAWAELERRVFGG